jgi:DNA-binding XRE family transcriptional regulator
MTQRKAMSNNVRTLREEILLSKAELARRAGISPLTVDRIEGGAECRLDTKRKIILALGKKLEEKQEVFPDLGVGRVDDEETGEALVKKSGKKE